MELKKNVLLLSMPWTTLLEPSLGLGILKAELETENVKCTVKHLNLLLLEYLSYETYISLSNIYALNDFLFTHIFEEKISNHQLEKLDSRLEFIIQNNPHFNKEYKSKSNLKNLIIKVRNEVIPQYLEACLKEIEIEKYGIIGFTCLFDQTIASLALAKKIKEKYPSKYILFGGYGLEGDVGSQIISSFDFVDCICYGEGEETIKEIVFSYPNIDSFHHIAGLEYRYNNQIIKSIGSKSKLNLDNTAIPNYDDFARDLALLEQNQKVFIDWATMPIETSRGCWWGQIKHCIFCGIDDETMKYRQKSVDTTLNMYKVLREKYGNKVFRISDYILPNNYYSTLLPQLSKINKESDCFFTCEIKANVNYDKMKLLKNAGFAEVQPGIESFSSSILKKIDKGVSGIQNILCLTLGKNLGVKIDYNILYGFPNDTIEDYEDLVKIIPFLYHLDPPSNRTEVAVTRFAPMQNDPKRFGVTKEIEYDKNYEIIFSNEYINQINFDYNNYCYYFELPYEISPELNRLYKILTYQVDYWTSSHKLRNPELYFELIEEEIVFFDSRYEDEAKRLNFPIKFYHVYRECINKITTISQIKTSLSSVLKSHVVEEIIETFKENRLVIFEGNKFMGLATDKENMISKEKRVKSNQWSFPFT